ncbi:hypothetical protein UK23_10610 [Lentzea aerocolonigenes]|uniref:Uncharacterized protein n=1 Tax=Lentzea aerocolonigenes TaxID=68170 RepID=A0A0F0H404_LENAE|nr:hypothetical protein [Lentzea aerocolonigenes]KJK50439.1 hypothetical protein UK23_10610 [Lentzea aerocolonigenes]
MFEQVERSRKKLLHVYDEPQPTWVDLGEVRRSLLGASDSIWPASARGMSLDGLAVAEVPFAVRMAPTLWLGLVTYEVHVPRVGTIAMQHFVRSDQTKKRQKGEVEPPY